MSEKNSNGSCCFHTIANTLGQAMTGHGTGVNPHGCHRRGHFRLERRLRCHLTWSCTLGQRPVSHLNQNVSDDRRSRRRRHSEHTCSRVHNDEWNATCLLVASVSSRVDVGVHGPKCLASFQVWCAVSDSSHKAKQSNTQSDWLQRSVNNEALNQSHTPFTCLSQVNNAMKKDGINTCCTTRDDEKLHELSTRPCKLQTYPTHFSHVDHISRLRNRVFYLLLRRRKHPRPSTENSVCWQNSDSAIAATGTAMKL